MRIDPTIAALTNIQRLRLQNAITQSLGGILADDGEIYGKPHRPGEAHGMRYGYVFLKNTYGRGREWVIVDASCDGPDRIVARVEC